MKHCFGFFGLFLSAVKSEHHLRIPTNLLESSQASGCTTEGADPWSTGDHVPCCSGLEEELVEDPPGNWHYICVSVSCTGEGEDPWSTGDHVPCCSGLEEELVEDPPGNWHYICTSSAPTPPAPTPPAPTPPAPTPAPTPVSCTGEGEDPWSTGVHVPCCSGLVEELVEDPPGNWHYICTSSAPTPPAPTPPAPTPPAPTPPAPTPSTTPGMGLCYGYGYPCDQYDGGCSAKVSDDMQRVANCPATSDVNRIRTYAPSYYGTLVDALSGFAGKSLLPGFNPRDALDWQTQLEDDLRQVYGSDQVDGIIYLNENFADQDITWARDFLQATTKTPGKPIVTSQTTQTDYSVYTQLLAQGFDGIIINIYPNGVFSHDMSLTPESAFFDFCTQLSKVSEYYRSATGTGENFYGVGETGIASDPFGAEFTKDYYELIKAFVTGTRSCQDFSYNDLVDMHGGPTEWLGVYAFEATSEPNKGSPLENSFGITDAICPSSENGDFMAEMTTKFAGSDKGDFMDETAAQFA